MSLELNRRYKILLTLIVLMISLFVGVDSIKANPYFYILGNAVAGTNEVNTWAIFLYTDGYTVTATQFAVNYDSTYLSGYSSSSFGGACGLTGIPATIGRGGTYPTPYFYNNQYVFACGFTNPGYTSSVANGDLIARMTYIPIAEGNTSFSFTGVLFRYIGTSIAPSSSSSFDVQIVEGSGSATPEATPYATATPSATPTPTATATSTSTSSGTVTPTPLPTTITDEDLTFVEIGESAGGGTTGSGDTSNLSLVEEDDTIPPAPNMTPRPKATPFSLVKAGEQLIEQGGQVLSVQSLRELLIPGKSEADRTVVMFNLISTLLFLALLTIVLWKLLTSSRINKIKYQHMTDMLSSELAVIENKLGAMGNTEVVASAKADLDKAIESLLMNNKGSKKNGK